MNGSTIQDAYPKEIDAGTSQWRTPFREAAMALPLLKRKLEESRALAKCVCGRSDIPRCEQDAAILDVDQAWEALCQQSLTLTVSNASSIEELATKARYLLLSLEEEPDDLAAQLAQSLTRDILRIVDRKK